MSGERKVVRPLVARKRDGTRLDLILIDAGRVVDVLGIEDTANFLLRYKEHLLVADRRSVHARTVPLLAAATTA